MPACHAGGRGFESRPVRHLSNTQIYHRSPKKFQMSENPRVRQIAQAIWTFGYAERPEGVRKAPRLLESFPSGPPFVIHSNLSPLSKKFQMSENPRVRQIAKAIWTFGCAERPEGVKKAPRLLESLIVESNLDVRLRRAPRRGEKSPKAFRIIPVRSAICLCC